MHHNNHTQYTRSDKHTDKIPIKHHGIHIRVYTRNPYYIYNSLLHTKSLRLSHLTVFIPLLLQCRTPYAVIHSLVLLKMGIMLSETCWDISLIIRVNTRLVASCWFLFLHPIYIYIYISIHFIELTFSRPSNTSVGDVNVSYRYPQS